MNDKRVRTIDDAVAEADAAGLSVRVVPRMAAEDGWVVWHGGGGTRRRDDASTIAYIDGLIAKAREN